MKNYKLVVLFVKYGNEQYPNAQIDLDNFLKDINCDLQVFTIENKDIIIPPYSVYYISGDNSSWEFSAWDKGLKYLKDNNVEYDAVLFVNSSFMNNRINGVGGHPSTVINKNSLKLCIDKNKAIFPWLTTGPRYFELDGIDVSSWYRTNCFLLNKNHINILQNIKSCDNIYINKFIEENISNNYFKDDAPMNNTLKDFIIWRLTVNWHKPIIISENWELFRMKTLAYINEMMLTYRLRQGNIDVIAEK